MSSRRLWCIWLTIAGLIFILPDIEAQGEDSAYILTYAKRNNTELSNAYNNTRLRFRTSGQLSSGETANFFSNNGLFTGIYLNYKWATIGYGINVPFTSRDNTVKGFKSYRLHINSYYRGWGISGSSDIYKGLLSQTVKNAYTPVDGVRYTSISADFFRVDNALRDSYRAAQYLGEQQLKSCGSFIYHVRPSYSALGLQSSPSAAGDSAQAFINGNPRWLSLIASLGYGYNAVWNGGKWIVAPRAETGFGGLYQFGIEKRLRPAVFYRVALTTGYSTGNLYTYLSAETTNTTNLLASATLSDSRLRLSLTAGYRLPNLKKKILGIL